MVKGKVVSIMVDGKEVVGEVSFRSFNDISVGYCGLHRGSHMPWFALHVQTFDGEYGDKAIEGILQQLYWNIIFIENNKESLREYVSILDKELQDLYVTAMNDDVFKEQKSILRKGFKGGDIDNKVYQKKLQELKRLHSDYHYGIHKLYDRFFTSTAYNLRCRNDEDTVSVIRNMVV